MAGIDVGTVYVTVLPDTSKFTAGLTAAANTAGATASKSLSSQFSKAGRGLSTFGRSMTRFVTLPLALAGGAAVKLATDFDQSMRNVNSLLGLSEQRFKDMSNAVLRLSTQTPQTAQELSEGLYDIASSGFAGKDALTVLDAAATAASAGLSTTATASRAVVSTLNAYGEGAQLAERNSDILFQGVNVGVQTFDELANSIGNYIGAASQLEVPLQDVVGAQAAMTLTGLDAAAASVSLNGIFKTLLKPSDELAAALKEQGFQTGQAALESEGLQGVIEFLSDEVGNNKSKWVELFPEIRAARGAMALATDDGKLLDTTMQKMAGSVGAAGRAFKEQSKGPAFQFEIAMNKLRKAGIKLGNELIPIITETIIPAVEDAIRWFRQLSPEAKELGIQLAGLALVAGPLLRLGGSLLKLTGWIAGFTKAAVPATTAATGLAGAAGVTAAGAGTAGLFGAGAATLAARSSTAGVGALTQVGMAGGRFATGLGAGGVGFGAGTIPLTPFNVQIPLEDLDAVDELTGRLAASGANLEQVTQQLNAQFAAEGRELRVNAELLRFAQDRGIGYGEALETVGGAFEITSKALRDRFLPSLERGTDITVAQQSRMAALVNEIDRLGGGLGDVTLAQIGNLAAAGDQAAIYRILLGRIEAVRNAQRGENDQNERGAEVTRRHAEATSNLSRRLLNVKASQQEAGNAADTAAGKVSGYVRELDKIPPKVTTKIDADTSPAEAELMAFLQRVGNTRASIALGITPPTTGKGGEHGAFIPGMARGGFVFGEQLLRVGEKSKGEMVLPLEDARGHRALVRALSEAMDGRRGDATRLVIIEGKVDPVDGQVRILAREEDNAERRQQGVLARMNR